MYFSRCARRREARRAEASSSATNRGEGPSARGGETVSRRELPEAPPRCGTRSRSRSSSNPPKKTSSSSPARRSREKGGLASSEDSLASSLDPRRASRRSASARLERALRGAESFESFSPQPVPRDAARARPSDAPSKPPSSLFARRNVAGVVKSLRPSLSRLGAALAVASPPPGVPGRARERLPGASGDGGVSGGARGGGRARSNLGVRTGDARRVAAGSSSVTLAVSAPSTAADASTADSSSSAPASANESSSGSGSVAAEASGGLSRRKSASSRERPRLGANESSSGSGSVAAVSPALANLPSRLSVSESSAAADSNASAASLRASPTRLVGAVSRIAPSALAPGRAIDPNPSTATATSSGTTRARASFATSSTRLFLVTVDVATPGRAERARGGARGARRFPPPSVSVPETNSAPDEAAGALDVSIGSSKESSAASDASSKASSSPRPVSARRPPSPFPSPTRLASRYAASPSSASSAETNKLSSSIAAARPRATRGDNRGLAIAFSQRERC